MQMLKKNGPGSGARRVATVAVAFFAAASCSADPTEPGASDGFQVQAAGAEDSVRIMTQNVVQGTVMDAHFEGLVVADGDGCLRLAEQEGPTVVWPLGYTGQASADEIAILDGGDTEVGRVDGTFIFGGGIVSGLHETLGFNQADRNLAEELCPGSYWIVSS